MTSTLFFYIRQHSWLLAGVLICSVLVPGVAVLAPLFAGAAIDGHSGAIAGLLAAATARFAIHGSRRFLSGTLSVHVQHSLRLAVMRRLLSIDAAQSARLRTGQVVSRTISDLGQVQSMVATLPIILTGLLEVVLICGILLFMSPPVGLLVIAHLPVMFFVAARSRKRLYPATWVAQQQTAEIASHIEHSVAGVRVVKNFGQQPRMLARFTELASTLFGLRLVVGHITARFQPALNALPNIMLVGVVAVGGWLAAHGQLTVGEFLATATFITMLARLTRMTSSMLVGVFVARSSVRRLEELLELPVRPNPEQSPSNPVVSLRGTLNSRDGHPVHVDIPAGRTTVIMGGPASGKTYLAHALAGLRTEAASNFRAELADGTALPLLDVPENARPILVANEPFLFSASIRENVCLGSKATDEQVLEALRVACADGFVADLGGLDTVVGERGLTLSGGQRQRIALARAVLRNPSFLILDAATSAIDTITEHRIMQNLEERTQGLTTVVIGHRHSTEQQPTLTLPEPQSHELWPIDPPRAASALQESPAGAEAIYSATKESPRVESYTAPFSLRSLISLIRMPLIAVVATLLVTVLADITLPSFIRYALDEGVAKTNLSVIASMAAAALAVVLVSWAALALNTVLTMRAGENLLYALRLRCYRQLGRMDIKWFETHSSGQIMTRLTTDIDSLSNFLYNGLSQTIVSVTVLIGVLAMLLFTDPTLTAITALFLPVIAVASWVFKRTASRLYTESRAQVSQVNSTFQESIYGLLATQSYGYGPHLAARLDGESAKYRHLRTKAQAAVSIFFPGINWLTELAQASILAVGGSLIASGHTTEGAVVAFSLYLSIFFGPVQQLSQIFDSFQQASVGLTRIGDFLRTEPEVRSPASPRPVPVSGVPSIVFDATRFRYSTDSEQDPVLDIDTTISGVTAVVGATGAGKSTLGKLVARWYDPQQGAVLAEYPDAQALPILEAELEGWRRKIGTVPQEPYFFPTTVAHNIAFGQPDASREEIQRAVQEIGGEEIIAGIPGGFLAPLDELGGNLSAGQRQIIALARAVLLQPCVMVLDEATSTLPPEIEEKVVQAITNAVQGRTAIIIAHRLATAARADRVLVMDGGQIVESGTHAELLALRGHYAQLWERHITHGS